jgi:hypothetical protein
MTNVIEIMDAELDGVSGGIRGFGAPGGGLQSNAEIAMISIQGLMSQRQTTIALVTGMIASMDGTAKSVAQNIGR